MSLEDLNIVAAIRCARIVAALYQPRLTPPTWLVDHLALLEDRASGSANGTKHEVPQQELEPIGTAEAARILGCSPRYIRRIHADLDGRLIANRWFFDRKLVVEYGEHRMAS